MIPRRGSVPLLLAVALLILAPSPTSHRGGYAGLFVSGSNTTPIEIPNDCIFCTAGPASPYPSSIDLSGAPAGSVVDKLEMRLNGLTHTNPDDIDMLLVAPDGKAVEIMSDAGGSTDLADVDIQFDWMSGFPLPNDGPLTIGPYVPGDAEPGNDPYEDPAPAGQTSVNAFAGSPVNGTWSLYIMDDTTGSDDGGSLADGWSIDLIPDPPPDMRFPAPPPTFVENGPPVLLDETATFVDPETNDYYATFISIDWTNLTSADALTIVNEGSGPGLIGVSGNRILHSGQEVAEFAGGIGEPMGIEITTSAATPALLQTLLRHIQFAVGSESPSGKDRTFTFALSTLGGHGGSTTASKVVHVQPVADPPGITAIANQSIAEDSATPILAFTLTDVDTPVAALTISGASSNAALLPAARIVFGGSGANRTVRLTPAANTNGTVDVTITASDGAGSATEMFRLAVRPVPDPTLLRIRKHGSGGGIITSAPGGVNCGADCSETYEVNTTVRLKAAPRLHSFFAGWTAGCTGRGDCVVKLTTATLVRARFVRPSCLGQPATRVGAGVLDGTFRDDVLVGTAGANKINGRGGNDRICSGGGNDVVTGGPGNDTIQAGGGKDHVSGNAGNDVANGGVGEDRLLGGTGMDRVSGNPGDDVLNGGPGSPDRCDGGPGVDRLATGHECEVLFGIHRAAVTGAHYALPGWPGEPGRRTTRVSLR
jgi:Ca2+-binding RTX toxin-like protein